MEKNTRNITDELIDRCRENDRDAQFELYKRYYKQMYNTSLRILNNTAEAEDIMQESFLDAFRKMDDYTGDGSFGGWLRRIVVNNSLDALKKRKPDVFLEEDVVDTPAETTYDPDYISLRVESVKKAMDCLSADDRVIISLFLFEGYDHEEISSILNISYGASRTRFSRARKRLLDTVAQENKINTIHPN